MKQFHEMNHEELITALKDEQAADRYFSSILEKCKNLEKDKADALLLEALQNIAQARPDDVNVDISNKASFTMRVALRLLRFISNRLM